MKLKKEFLKNGALDNPEDDLFGYASFAQSISEMLINIEAEESKIIALNGPCVSGKTTCLNFILHFLNLKEKKDRPIVIRLDLCYLLTSTENLIKQFFKEIFVVLYKYNDFKEILNLLAQYAEIIFNIYEPENLKKSNISSSLLKLALKDKEIYKLKEQIKESFKKRKKNILIFIDNLDMLKSEVIFDIFFIIKSILNFPKMIYLSCFDKDTVFKKLESLNNKNKSIYESDYFKKIINVFLELPIPNVCRLASLVFEELETYFKKFDENLEYWEIIFFYFLQKYFNTIYDCKRLLNIIKITYPTVKDEVNIIDFIIIRLIEIFFPNIYKLIYQNSNMFVDLNSIESDESADIYYSDQKVEEFHNNWLKNVSKNDRDNIIPLLSLLFPRFENAINKKIISNSSYNVKKFAISNLNNFFVYFNYSQPERGLSAKEFKVILSNVKNKKYFKEKLLELLNKSNKRLEAFLKMMIDYTDEIQIDDIPNILEVFFDMGDKILNLSNSQYYDDYINEIILKLIQKYNNISERFKILKEMFLKSNSISIIVNVLFMLGSQHNKYGLLGTTKNNFPNEYLLSVEQVGDLGKIVLSKIEKGIKENNLINTPRLWYVLYIWLFLAKDYSMKKIGKWIEEIIKTDDNLIKFIRNMLNVGLKLKITNSDERIFWNPCNLERFGYFLDPSKIIKRCETIYYTLPNWLSDDDKYVLEKFLRYNFLTKLRKNKK